MKNNIYGILYFFIHFIIEITSFYIISTYVKNNIFWTIALVYDFCAFVPQGIFGYFIDKGSKLNYSLIGMLLSILALVFLYFKLDAFMIVLTLSIGNAFVHIDGAEKTLKSSEGKMSAPAIFVSGGSFGVITGKLLAMYHVKVIYIILINLLMLIPIMLANKFKHQLNDNNLDKYNFANKSINYKKIVILATFVVIVRAYMGYGIPTSWNKTLIQTIILYSFMGIGKALGGICIDLIGIRKTALISTIGSLPLLVFGNNMMSISLIGIMLFSMTMAITLGLIVSVIPKYPGVAFGCTTLGLFLGSLPVFFYKINSFIINFLIVTILTLVCAIILYIICRKESV